MTQEERDLMIKIATAVTEAMKSMVGNQVAILGVDARVNSIEKFILEELQETAPSPVVSRVPQLSDPLIGPMRVTTHIDKKMPDGSLAFKLDVSFENAENIPPQERMVKSLSFFAELDGVMKKYGVAKIIGEFDRKKTYGSV